MQLSRWVCCPCGKAHTAPASLTVPTYCPGCGNDLRKQLLEAGQTCSSR